MRVFGALASILLLGLGGLGCPPKSGPADAVERYVESVEAERPAEAWALLTGEARQETRWEDFEDRARRIARRQEQGYSEHDTCLAELRARWGDTGPSVVWRQDAWVIEKGLSEPYPRSSPELTLRSVVEAYHAKRWDLLWEMAPGDIRRLMTVDAMQKIWESGEFEDVVGPRIEALGRALSEGAETSRLPSERAVLEYGPYRAVLVREGEVWCVVDL